MHEKARSSEAANTVKGAVQDAVQGLKIFVVNPVGGLPDFFSGLGKQRALGVGIAFGVIYLLCVLFSVGSLFSDFAVRPPTFKLILMAVITFGSIAGSSFVTRKIFRGFGSIEGDVFIAGASLIPVSFLMLVTRFLGIGNLEIVAAISIVCITYTVLMIYTGCTQISRISESLAALSVSVMIIISVWLSKVLAFSAISSSLE